MYCTAAEVRAAIDFPATGAPVSDAIITTFIIQAQDEIEDIYNTHFGGIEATLTAVSGTTTTITNAAGTYDTADEYVGYVVWVYEGTNSGEYREVTTNSTTTLTVSPAFSAAIDNTSQFRLTKLGYKSETVDGSGNSTQFTRLQPLINLNTLTIDSTSITPANVYQYKDSGRLVLGDDSEVSYFSDNRPKLIDMQYVYGVYPLPNTIKRLCIILSSIKTLVSQISGTYDSFTSFSLPGGVTASLGEPYTNIREAVSGLQGEARGIIYGAGTTGQIGGGLRILPSYRPFVNFG